MEMIGLQENDTREIVGKVVSPETGEILNIIRVGDRIISPKEETEKDKNIIIADKLYFTKTIRGFSTMLYEEKLTGNQYGLIQIMFDYMGYNSGLIRFSNGKPIKVKHLAVWTNRPERAIYRDLKALSDKQLVFSVKTDIGSFYVLNPFVFMCGTQINDTVYEAFQHTKWKVKYDSICEENIKNKKKSS